MSELSRAEFDAWVKSEVGKMFSHGKIASIEFYYLVWKAGMQAGIERARLKRELIAPYDERERIAALVAERADLIRWMRLASLSKGDLDAAIAKLEQQT